MSRGSSATARGPATGASLDEQTESPLPRLGVLYRDTGRLADAEKAYTEALAIYRDLAQRDPAAYRPYVATTLNNLGVRHNGRDDDRAGADRQRMLAVKNSTYRQPAASPSAPLWDPRG